MVLVCALMRGIHPPDNNQNGGRPGGGECLSLSLSQAHWLGLWHQHFDDVYKSKQMLQNIASKRYLMNASHCFDFTEKLFCKV